MSSENRKSALITGASKGMGRAIALSLAEEGYDLALCARNIEGLQRVAEEIEARNPQVKVYLKVCDFLQQKEIEDLAYWGREHFHNLDVLVNNVGIYERVSLLDEDLNALNKHMQVNLNGPHFLSAYFGDIMREAGKGHIFNITSIAAREPVAAAAAYTITKFALEGLTKVLREELRRHGVKVTEIIPGSTLTSSWDGTDIPAEDFVLPEDIAKVIVSCLSLSAGANIEEVIIRPIKKF